MPLRTYTIDPNEPVVVRTYENAYEAEFGRVLLEAAGIPCAVVGEWYAEVTPVRVRLMVRRMDLDVAREALDAPPGVTDADVDDTGEGDTAT